MDNMSFLWQERSKETAVRREAQERWEENREGLRITSEEEAEVQTRRRGAANEEEG